MAAGILCTRLVVDGEPEVLMIKRSWNKVWEFPKGRRRHPECLRATALREFEEETGANLDDWGPSGAQRALMIDVGTSEYSTPYELRKIVQWYWVHSTHFLDLWPREARTNEVAWFTARQLHDVAVKGGWYMKGMGEQALSFASGRGRTR